jgi:hypothetical protein
MVAETLTFFPAISRESVTTFEVVLRIRLLDGVKNPREARFASTLTKSGTGAESRLSGS